MKRTFSIALSVFLAFLPGCSSPSGQPGFLAVEIEFTPDGVNRLNTIPILGPGRRLEYPGPFGVEYLCLNRKGEIIHTGYLREDPRRRWMHVPDGPGVMVTNAVSRTFVRAPRGTVKVELRSLPERTVIGTVRP